MSAEILFEALMKKADRPLNEIVAETRKENEIRYKAMEKYITRYVNRMVKRWKQNNKLTELNKENNP